MMSALTSHSPHPPHPSPPVIHLCIKPFNISPPTHIRSPLVSEMTFQDRWERNMVKLGRLPASWGDMLRKKEAMGDANSVNATAAAAGVGVGAGSPTMFARHHDPGAHTHTLHHGHAGASVPVAVPDSNGIASSSGGEGAGASDSSSGGGRACFGYAATLPTPSLLHHPCFTQSPFPSTLAHSPTPAPP